MSYETNTERLIELQPRKGRYDQLRYLRLDRARYGRRAVPCQMLASSFDIPGVNYYTTTDGGVEIPVNKKAVGALMERGAFVCVTQPRLKPLPGSAQTFMGLWIGTEVLKFADICDYQRPMDDEEFCSLVGQRLERPTSGKKLIYRFDEQRGLGINLIRAGVKGEDHSND